MNAPPKEPSWLLCEQAEASLALSLAREAQRRWAAVPVTRRAAILSRAADALLERMDEVVALIHEENGKPPVEALAHEVAPSLAILRWLCEQAHHALADRPSTNAWLPHRRAVIRRSPWGVVLVISPWNFPLSIPLGQVVAALLAGNAVVLKPSEVTPRCGTLIAELLAACELPANLFQLVQGDGQAGAQLIDAKPDKVLFTGSLATGRKVMAAAARYPIPVCLELGGVDALIVLDDADLELASSAAAWGGLINGGQVCASVERVLVHREVHQRFKARLIEKMRALEPSTDLAPYTAEKQRAVYEAQLKDARARGLTFLCGGEWIDERTLQPTLIEGDGIEDAKVYCEESFGPLIALRTFRNDKEAVAMHDALDGALTASIFSRDHARARRLADALRVGLASINDVGATLHAAPELPWGGVGVSGFGRSHGIEGLLELTWAKVVDTPRLAHSDFRRPWWFPYDVDQRALLHAYARLIGERRLSRRVKAAGDALRSALGMLLRRPRL